MFTDARSRVYTHAAENQASFAAAGAVAPLITMLRSPADAMRLMAADALWSLALSGAPHGFITLAHFGARCLAIPAVCLPRMLRICSCGLCPHEPAEHCACVDLYFCCSFACVRLGNARVWEMVR